MTLVRLLFALLLVFAQQQAVSHALGHDLARLHAPSQDATPHDDAFCAKCLALGHLDHADAGGLVAPPGLGFAPPRAASVAPHRHRPIFVGVYRSRAPPLFA